MANIDKRNVRYLELAATEADVTVLNGRKVIVKINTTLPIVKVPTSIVVIDTIDTPTPAVASVFNVLTDPTDVARIKYLGTSVSYTSGSKVDLYYDSKFKDILIVPSTESFGINADVDIYANAPAFVIEGYRVGSGIKHDGYLIQNDMSATNENEMSQLPECKRLASLGSSLLLLPGFDSTSLYSGVEVMKDGITNFTRGRVLPQQYIKIGNADDLVANGGDKLPTYGLIQYAPGKNGLTYIGRKNLTELYIPLNF